MYLLDIPDFIDKHITKRAASLFEEDVLSHEAALKSNIRGKSILVIGGAGTIGSNYIKAMLAYEPASLVVVDTSENELTELTRDLRSDKSIKVPGKYITYPFDFGSAVFEKLLYSHHFDIVACFAAHKHVRSEKDHLAIEAMINNNVFNTHKLLENLMSNKPAHFFSVSTDKAANPVNVMGASKKLMEKILLAYSSEMKITTARFANVAFSNGSLLYGFVQRLMKRQPLSAPADVKRYFVSPTESGQLCMLASVLGQSGDIFFPGLEENAMMTFSEIAEKFLFEMGLQPDYCQTETEAKEKAANWTQHHRTYPVYFFNSDTSGEKMYEEFFESSDILDLKSFHRLGIIKLKDKPDMGTLNELLSEFRSLFSGQASKDDIIKLINKHIPGFTHIETGKNLDSKM